MKLFRLFGYVAIALLMSVGFAGCSEDDSSEQQQEQVKEYSSSTINFTCECMGNFYRLVDLSVEVYVNGVKSTTFTDSFDGSLMNVVVGDVAPMSRVEIKILAKRNSTAIKETTIYGHQVIPSVSVFRTFNDGSVEQGGNMNLLSSSVSALDHDTLEEYIQLHGDESYTIVLDNRGALNNDLTH